MYVIVTISVTIKSEWYYGFPVGLWSCCETPAVPLLAIILSVLYAVWLNRGLKGTNRSLTKLVILQSQTSLCKIYRAVYITKKKKNSVTLKTALESAWTLLQAMVDTNTWANFRPSMCEDVVISQIRTICKVILENNCHLIARCNNREKGASSLKIVDGFIATRQKQRLDSQIVSFNLKELPVNIEGDVNHQRNYGPHWSWRV